MTLTLYHKKKKDAARLFMAEQIIILNLCTLLKLLGYHEIYYTNINITL